MKTSFEAFILRTELRHAMPSTTTTECDPSEWISLLQRIVIKKRVRSIDDLLKRMVKGLAQEIYDKQPLKVFTSDYFETTINRTLKDILDNTKILFHSLCVDQVSLIKNPDISVVSHSLKQIYDDIKSIFDRNRTVLSFNKDSIVGFCKTKTNDLALINNFHRLFDAKSPSTYGNILVLLEAMMAEEAEFLAQRRDICTSFTNKFWEYPRVLQVFKDRIVPCFEQEHMDAISEITSITHNQLQACSDPATSDLDWTLLGLTYIKKTEDILAYRVLSEAFVAQSAALRQKYAAIFTKLVSIDADGFSLNALTPVITNFKEDEARCDRVLEVLDHTNGISLAQVWKIISVETNSMYAALEEASAHLKADRAQRLAIEQLTYQLAEKLGRRLLVIPEIKRTLTDKPINECFQTQWLSLIALCMQNNSPIDCTVDMFQSLIDYLEERMKTSTFKTPESMSVVLACIGLYRALPVEFSAETSCKVETLFQASKAYYTQHIGQKLLESLNFSLRKTSFYYQWFESAAVKAATEHLYDVTQALINNPEDDSIILALYSAMYYQQAVLKQTWWYFFFSCLRPYLDVSLVLTTALNDMDDLVDLGLYDARLNQNAKRAGFLTYFRHQLDQITIPTDKKALWAEVLIHINQCLNQMIDVNAIGDLKTYLESEKMQFINTSTYRLFGSQPKNPMDALIAPLDRLLTQKRCMDIPLI